jgi:hypothetical protein
MMENYALYITLAGLAAMIVGWFWMLIRAFRHHLGSGLAILVLPPLAVLFGLRHWRKGLAPLTWIAVGFLLTAFPPAYSLLVPIDLGPRETIVNGQRHITLTGWDRKDYGLLGSKNDVVVLQMANPDVTDQTLDKLKGMNELKDLDLNDTQITDAGLKVLKELPALSSLRLKNTKITDQGFQDALGGKESLMQLDLTGTGVSHETVKAWREAKSGRRAMR